MSIEDWRGAGLGDGVLDQFGGDLFGQVSGAEVGVGDGVSAGLVGADLAATAVAGGGGGDGGLGGAGHLRICGWVPVSSGLP